MYLKGFCKYLELTQKDILIHRIKSFQQETSLQKNKTSGEICGNKN